MANELRERTKEGKAASPKPDKQGAAGVVPQQEVVQPKRLTAFGRFMVFVGVPFSVGSIGLFVGYLRTLNDPDKKLNIDSDFIFPFLLALVMIVVIGFQTNNFQGKAKPLVVWPKVKRRKKIVHKTVIVDDEDEDTDGDAADGKQHKD